MALLLLLASFGTTAETSQQAAVLTGTVKNQAGAPVPGASVFIRTAGPRKGVGYL